MEVKLMYPILSATGSLSKESESYFANRMDWVGYINKGTPMQATNEGTTMKVF